MFHFWSFLKRAKDKVSLFVGGNNYGSIKVVNKKISKKQLTQIETKIDKLLERASPASHLELAGEVLIRDAVDVENNSEIDNLAQLIVQGRPQAALEAFTILYERLASKAQGKVRFRILANIGVCHYYLGDLVKAASYLTESYMHAPLEPKANSNNALGLIFQDKAQEAFKFSKNALQKDPTNAELAGYLAQTAYTDPELLDPIEIIPDNLKYTDDVYLGRIIFYRHRGSIKNWSAIAAEGVSKFPESEQLRFYKAVGVIETIIPPTANKNSLVLNNDQIANLREACTNLETKWSHYSNRGEGQVGSELKVTIYSLIEIYLILKDFKKVELLLESAISKNLTDDDYFIKLATYAHSYHWQLAEKALQKVSDASLTGFMKFKIAEQKGDNNYLASVTSSEIDSFPEPEITCCRVLQAIMKIKVENSEFDDSNIDNLIALAGDDARALLSIARAGEFHKNQAKGELAYTKAKALINSESNLSARIMLAREASQRHDYTAVIYALDGYISTLENSFEFGLLVNAFANSKPVTSRAVEFFDDLPDNLKNDYRYEVLQGVMFLNLGDIDRATNHLTAAVKADPSNIEFFLLLSEALRSKNDLASLKKIIDNINPFEMIGSDHNKMALAQLINSHGRHAEAQSLGYEMMSINRNNRQFLLAYMQIFLMRSIELGQEQDQDSEELLVEESHLHPKKVVKGCWVRLESERNDKFEFLYDSENEITHIDITDASNTIVESSLGLSVGDSFVHRRFNGPDHTWTIKEIKHKHLHAFHDILDNVEKRFPDAPFFRLDIVDNDISSLLDSIKKITENRDKALEDYARLKMPLALLGKRLGHDSVIIAAERLLGKSIDIRANTGDIQHVELAINLIDVHKIDSLVFDTYTAWHLALTDLLPVLAESFKLIVPASVVTEIQSTIDSYLAHSGESLSLENGQPRLYAFSAEQINESVESFRNCIEKIKQYCALENYTWDEAPIGIVEKFISGIEPHFWDAACLSKRANHMLISEDMHYRAVSAIGVNAVCGSSLYPVLLYLQFKNRIPEDQFANTIVHLARWRHSNIFWSPQLLKSIFILDESQELFKLRSVLYFVGVDQDDSDLMFKQSHLVGNFLNEIWGSDSSPEKIKLASDLTITSLLRFTNQKAFYVCVIGSQADEPFSEFLAEWRVINGIADDEMMEANAKFYAQNNKET